MLSSIQICFQAIINLYLLTQISRQFCGGWAVKEEILPIPAKIPFPKDNDIIKLMDLLLKSKKPVLVIGSQAVLPPISVCELRNAVKVCSTCSLSALRLMADGFSFIEQNIRSVLLKN